MNYQTSEIITKVMDAYLKFIKILIQMSERFWFQQTRLNK